MSVQIRRVRQRIPRAGEIPPAVSPGPPLPDARWNSYPILTPNISERFCLSKTFTWRLRTGIDNVTANHGYQAHEDAFHSLGGQSDRGDGCDLTGGKALAVAKPKNRTLSFLILARRKLSQDLVDLRDLKALAYRIPAVGAGGFRVDRDLVHERFGLPRTPLCGQRRLEMIVDDVGRNHLQKPINGIFVVRLGTNAINGNGSRRASGRHPGSSRPVEGGRVRPSGARCAARRRRSLHGIAGQTLPTPARLSSPRRLRLVLSTRTSRSASSTHP